MRANRLLSVLASLAALGAAMPAAGAGEPTVDAPAEVRVQRVKPDRPKLPMLRFLSANRDYLRAELDRLRVKRVDVGGDAAAIDPRFLRYGDMIAAARAAGDSAAAADLAREGRDLYASVTQLGSLEEELDGLDRALDAQRERLAALQSDYAGHQRTSLVVVLSGWPGGDDPGAVTISMEDGTRQSVSLTAEQREALRAGGAVQVMQRLVEPRDQLLAVSFGVADAPGWLELDPARNRLNLLRFDLARLAAGDAASVAATTWVLDDRTP